MDQPFDGIRRPHLKLCLKVYLKVCLKVYPTIKQKLSKSAKTAKTAKQLTLALI